ncbi:MAG: flavodoxin family protein [Dehalococcoidales bacterium]|nr:flavodoxin family protein [Dehalococcoidales bacterium]
MKILAVSCSPREKGNTITILEEVLRGAAGKQAETELYSVSGKTIQPCEGCWRCTRSGKCHIEDDMQELYDKLVEADGIVFGTPVYYYGMAGQAKTIIDRTLALNLPERSLANKVGGVVVTAGSLGLVDVLKDFSYFFVQRHMIPANQVSVYIQKPSEFQTMGKCREAAFQLGEQMVVLAETGFRYPEAYPQPHYAFGTHTK